MVRLAAGAARPRSARPGDAPRSQLAKEYFTEGHRASRKKEELRKWFELIRAKYGTIDVTNLRRTAEDTFIAVATGAKGGTVSFVVTHDEKFMVKGLGLEEPGGE